jgi:hypothetical protein
MFRRTMLPPSSGLLFYHSTTRLHDPEDLDSLYQSVGPPSSTRAVCEVRGVAAVRHCYAEGGGDSYAKL